MGLLSKFKAAPVEKRMGEALKTRVDTGDLFAFAPYDPGNAERGGYSNYSYWGSTLREFLKNKLALGLLIMLAALLLFTFIQPLLPRQYQANLIVNHPISGMHLSNVPPSASTVWAKAPQGLELIITPWEDDEWAAVSNVIRTIKSRTEFTILSYGEDYCLVEIDGRQGYIKNDFTTKLKLPDDPAATPYASRSNFAVKLYTAPEEYANGGDALFVHKEHLLIDGERAVTREPCELRILPSKAPFLFGTNNLGQDLWALVWSGTRTSLYIGFSAALIEALVGILIGVIWGYVRALDRLLTAVYNVVDNIPNTIVLILIAYIMRPGLFTLIFAMSLTRWVGMARFIRNQIIIIRDRDYNIASRCLGTGTWQVITRNLLPYLVSVIMLRMALAVPGAIGSEVFITYIGLGLPVSIPSLGNLINVGRKLISTSQSYQLVFPTIVLSIITISFYIIGNAFADAADPKNHV